MKKILIMKEVKIIMGIVVYMVMVKIIEEEVIWIHQTMKEQVKTHIIHEDVEDDTIYKL